MVRGHGEEFSAFAAARSATLYRTAYLMVGDRQLAQDLVQEALTKTYVAWPRLRDVNKAEPYARRVVVTTGITWKRRKAWSGERPVDVLPEQSSPSVTDEVDDRAALWQHLQNLPPRQRAALVLRFYEDLSVNQTAEALGCAEGTVKSLTSQGLESLRTRVGPGPILVGTDEPDLEREGDRA